MIGIGLLRIQVKYAITMTIIIAIIDAIPFIGSISILVTGNMIVNISTYVNLFILDVILLIIHRVVEPKLMDNYTGMIGLLAES
ncbi:hypothetical protein LSPCS325_37730 [Lysinibacillus sp. CTST325]